MRLVFALALLLAAPAAAAHERGYDRPGGVYLSLPASDADACARLCATDGLCLAWTYRLSREVSTCALKAVVPDLIPAPEAVSGVADRAGRFQALIAPRAPTAPPAPVAPEPLRPPLPPAPLIIGPADEADLLLGGL